MAEEKTDSKMNSRKFVVWVVWLVITLSVLVAGLFLKTSINDSMKELVTKVLDYFQDVSLLYLGANVVQKVGFAISNAMNTGEK